MDKPYQLSVSYDHGDRWANGEKFEDDAYTAFLTQKLTDTRSQYFMASYDDTNLNVGVHTDVNTGALAYGQIWQTNHPGLSFNLGAYATKGWNDYNGQAISGDDFVHSGSVGVLGGFAQALPVSAKDAFIVGSDFSVFYQLVENTPGAKQGTNATAYPFAQYTHMFSPQLDAYARFTTIASTTDVALGGSGVMFVPSAGVDYTMGDYKVGAKFSREFDHGYNGARVGITLSKSF